MFISTWLGDIRLVTILKKYEVVILGKVVLERTIIEEGIILFGVLHSQRCLTLLENVSHVYSLKSSIQICI